MHINYNHQNKNQKKKFQIFDDYLLWRIFRQTDKVIYVIKLSAYESKKWTSSHQFWSKNVAQNFKILLHRILLHFKILLHKNVAQTLLKILQYFSRGKKTYNIRKIANLMDF